MSTNRKHESWAIKEGQQFERGQEFVKGQDFSRPTADPFGDSISVVQDVSQVPETTVGSPGALEPPPSSAVDAGADSGD